MISSQTVDLLLSSTLKKIYLRFLNLTELFAQNVIYYRMLTGKSQEQLGFDSGIHRTDIGRIERAEISTSIRNIEKLANALDIPAYKLLMDSDDLQD